MQPVFLLLAIVLPLLGGALLPAFVRTRRGIRLWTGFFTVLTSALVWGLILRTPAEGLELVRFTERLSLTLRLDGLGRFFAGIVATLWPLTVLYGFEYMEHDERQGVFFAFFTISYAATLGVALAGNIFTLYCFYEFLSLSTVPLVMHTRTRDAIRATRTYFAVFLGGAAFAFLSILYLILCDGQPEPGVLGQFFFLCGFFGFGVKAAVFPLHFWLPKVSVAPTPVTALLHAVAVVKAGAFAVMRLIWCGYGVDFLRGTAAQQIALGFSIFTILFGAVMAVRERHFKRRIAYSTVSNLSYLQFGALLLSAQGLEAGLLHMAFHAEIKILAFFAVGAVLHHSGRQYLAELRGLGRSMPWTFGCFTAAALALTGIPPFAGFVSKWNLLLAAGQEGTPAAYIGAGVLLVSALLTAIYMFTVVQRAFFPMKEETPELAAKAAAGSGATADSRKIPASPADSAPREAHEAGLFMLIPMCLLALSVLVTGLMAGQIHDAIRAIVAGLGRW